MVYYSVSSDNAKAVKPKDLQTISASKLASTWGRPNTKNGVRELHRRINSVKDDDWPPASGWKAVCERIRTHSTEVVSLDSRGRTCLMAAARKANYAPAHILQLLLDNTCFGTETSRDKSGQTALLIALQVQTPQDSIRLLLTKNGRGQLLASNHQGNLPLHYVLYSIRRRVILAEEPDRRRELVDMFLEFGAREQILYENSLGLTPLHVALESRLPTDLVHQLIRGTYSLYLYSWMENATVEFLFFSFLLYTPLLQNFLCQPTACPEVVSKHAPGYTPLVSALRENAPVSTVKLLVETNPSVTFVRDEEKKFPLRRALERRIDHPDVIRLLCTSPEAVQDIDAFGLNCLTLVLDQWVVTPSSVNPAIIKILLEMAPDAAAEKRSRINPVKLCYRQFEQAVRNWEHFVESRQGRVVETAADLVERWWKVLMMILEAATIEAVWSPLGTVLQTDAPPIVVKRLLKDRPVCTRLVDSEGRYPLHLACMKLWKAKETILNMILAVDPSVAAFIDCDGRCPLNLACDCGGVSSLFFVSLIRAYPAALKVMDPKFQLYPFLVAAACSSEKDGDERTAASFELLVAAPDLLSFKSIA
jgi:ankyrin repeat protein